MKIKTAGFNIGDIVVISYYGIDYFVKILKMSETSQIALEVEQLSGYKHTFTTQFLTKHVEIRHATDEQKLKLL